MDILEEKKKRKKKRSPSAYIWQINLEIIWVFRSLGMAARCIFHICVQHWPSCTLFPCTDVCSTLELNGLLLVSPFWDFSHRIKFSQILSLDLHLMKPWSFSSFNSSITCSIPQVRLDSIYFTISTIESVLPSVPYERYLEKNLQPAYPTESTMLTAHIAFGR